ncbi:MAG: hypothetical protein RLZZ165_2141 [Bacteroidota bacterium]|jgi:ABC-type bacteriocin/lantibiotic exporter with double-glycine peptidase domain
MPENQQTESKLRSIQRLWRLIVSERPDITSIYLFAIAAGLISLSLPLGIQAIFNYVTTGQVSTSWVVLVVVVVLGVVANGLLQIFQTYLTEKIQQRIFTKSAIEFAYRIPRLRMDSLRKEVAPELVNRFFDTLTVQKGFSKMLMDISASSLQIIFGILLLSFYHPFFIVFGIFLAVLLTVVLWITGPKGLRTSMEESKYKYKVAYWLEEMARTLESFKLAGATRLPLTKIDHLVSKYLSARREHFKVLISNYALILGYKVVIICAMLVIGSFLVFDNQLNVGQFVAIEIVLILLMSAVEKLIRTFETVFDVLTALEKIASLTDLPLESDKGATVSTHSSHGLSLKIESLTLRFPDMGVPLVNHVNLNVKAGEWVNLITSDESFVKHFFRLLMGFYGGYQGSISFNGIPLQNIHLEDLRNMTGGYSTLQELFDGSLIENIHMGIEGVTLDRVLEIISAVGLDAFVRGEKDGLEMRLQLGGGNLPETIYRKIILARSLATHPSLLLLNDPFEGLSEDDVQGFLSYVQKWMPGATVILATKSRESRSFISQTYSVKEQHLLSYSPENN